MSNNPTPENATENDLIASLKEILDTMGLLNNLSPDLTNMKELAQQMTSRIKMLLSANRDLRTNYNNIKQEMDEITAAKENEDEKDRILRDLTQRIHQLREAVLKLSMEFQRQVSGQPNVEGFTQVIEKVDEFRNAQQSIQDMEQKLLLQRTLNSKTQRELNDRIHDLELQLTESQNKLKTTESKLSEAVQTNSTGGSFTESVSSEEHLKMSTKIDELTAQVERMRSENIRLHDELNQLKDAGAQLQEKSQIIREMENETQQKIRDIEALKNENQRVKELEEKIKQLNEDVIQRDNIIQQNNKQISEMQAQLQNLQSQVVLSGKQLEDFKGFQEKIANLEQINLEQLGKIKSFEDKIQEMTVNQDSMVKSNQIWQGKCEDANNNLQKISEDLSNANQKLEEYTNEIKRKSEKIEDLEGELKSRNAEYQKLRDEFSKVGQNESESLKALNDQLVLKDKIIEDLKQEIATEENKIAQMVHKDELAKLKAEIDNKNAQLKTQSDRLDQKEKEISQIQDQLIQIKATMEMKNQEIQNGLQQVNELQGIITEKNENLRGLETQIENLNKAVQENEQLKAQLEDAVKQLQEVIGQKGVLYEQIRNLKNTVSGDQAVIKRLEQKITDLQGKGLKENIEIELMRKKFDDLNNQLREQVAKAGENAGKAAVLKEQLDLVNPQILELKKENEMLKSKITESEGLLKIEIQTLSQQSMNKDKEIANLTEKLKALDNELIKAKEGEKFKEELTKVKRSLDEQNGINDRLADDVAKLKVEALVMKKENERLKDESIQLKRRIKLLRRDSGQS